MFSFSRVVRTLSAAVFAATVLGTSALPASAAYVERTSVMSTEDCLKYAATFGVEAAWDIPGCGFDL